MKLALLPRTSLMFVLGAVFILGSSGYAKDELPPATVAHSVVSPDFKRERLPSGEWEPITYTFGKGILVDPTGKDGSLTKLEFPELAGILAEALIEENYVPTQSIDDTDLVIVVNWGKTAPHADSLGDEALVSLSNSMSDIVAFNQSGISDKVQVGEPLTVSEEVQLSALDSYYSELTSMLLLTQFAESIRRKSNEETAQLLGYAPEMADLYKTSLGFGPTQTVLEQLEDEIESARYFVILQAYDFRQMREKKKKLLWMTRFSIRAKGRSFDEELANMSQSASSYFGRKSDRLGRNLRPGKGRLGEIEVVEVHEEESR